MSRILRPRPQQSPRHHRQERERLARREDILLAARQVFAERGYHAATLEEIAARADFGKGTLYNYFRSKTELFTHVVLRFLDEVQGVLEEAIRAGGGTRAVIERFAARSIELLKRDEDVLRILVREFSPLLMEAGSRSSGAILAAMQRTSAMLAGELGKDAALRRAPATPLELAEVLLGILHTRTLRHTVHGASMQHLDADHEAAVITRLFLDGAAAT